MAFASVAWHRESSLSIPSSPSFGSSTSKRRATYSPLPSLGFILARAFPICLSQAQYRMTSVRRVLDLLVPSFMDLSAWIRAERTWSLPQTMSGSIRTTSPPIEVKCFTMSSKGASPLIPITSAFMHVHRMVIL